jgi:NADH-quinone oxidoreductase subunit F
MPELDLMQLRKAIAAFVPQGRSGLLPALHAAQSIYGWISEPVAAEIGRVLGVPLADVHGVIEFYSMLYNEPIGQTIVRVCTDPARRARRPIVLAAACRKPASIAPVKPRPMAVTRSSGQPASVCATRASACA